MHETLKNFYLVLISCAIGFKWLSQDIGERNVHAISFKNNKAVSTMPTVMAMTTS
jgi:hypothetical protein